MFIGAAIAISLSSVAQIGPITHRMTLSAGLDSPARIAVTAAEILVTDPRSGVIRRFDTSGSPLSVWIESGGPVGVAVHADGRIFVSRRDAKVAVYDSTFTFLQFLGDGVVAFVQPTDLAVDPDSGLVYVVDSGADRVYAFDAAGALVLMFGIRGSGFGQFKYPSAIALDAINHRILVADQDNFRVQVFDTSGLFRFSFGYRIKYLPDGTSEGWFARVAGLAVDASGRVYVTDAIMGTLRVFDLRGAELGKLVGYGAAPGDLQTPCDVALDATGRVLIANSNVGTVEIYDPPSVAAAGELGTFYRGTNDSPFDAALRKVLGGVARLSRLTRTGPKSASLDADAVAVTGGWEPPHMLSDTPCARCHNIDGEPGGHAATVAGQSNLCLSCHTSGGHALDSAFRSADRVLNGSPAPDSGGRSHAWGVAAINASVGSVGPPAGSEMARYLSGGVIKCATCHNQHNNTAGSPYLRVSNRDGTLCKQCHVDYIGHTPQGSWQPTCSECHDTHNPKSGNLALVGTSVYNRTLGADKPVVFSARTGANSLDDGDPAANDGLCQVCHTATSYHRQDGSGTPHNNGQNCIDCHPHSAGFIPTGGDCISCHSVAQNNGDGIPPGGRRAVVGEFPVGDAHAHYGVELGTGACVVCHDQGTHMDGYVDLIDPDGGGVYRFQKPGDLTGDPDLSDFCAACHDSDGSARLATPFDPFGGGTVPLDVAGRFQGTLQWEEKYGDFCFGNEGTLRAVNSHHDISDADQAFSGAKIECLNCHGAHAASRTRPLTDPFANTTPWTGSGDGFCLSCHNGGTGPLDPSFPPGVAGPTIDATDPRWASLGFNWNNILGGACLGGACSSLRGVDSCDYVEGPWYVDYSWTHSAHGTDSKRGWPGYSGAPGAVTACVVCHDPHGSYSPTNSAGNPYMIRDFVDGTTFVDDGIRTAGGSGFNGPPWNTFGQARAVTVPVSGLNVGWGSANGLCTVCHADWLAAYDWHAYCTSCQTCHGHGMAWGEYDWVSPRDDTPCPGPPLGAMNSGAASDTVPRKGVTDDSATTPRLHQGKPDRE